MRAEHLVDLVASGQMNFQVELRFGIRQFFPRFADQSSLLLGVVMGGPADDDGAGLQRGGGAQDAVPQVVGRDDCLPNRFPALFRHGERLGKQMLLDAAEKLIGVQFVFAGCGTPQKPHDAGRLAANTEGVLSLRPDKGPA